MDEISMCGFRCKDCASYAPNIKKDDRRKELSDLWHDYYDLNVSPEKIYCDGCRCTRSDAVYADSTCPVRKCVIDKKLHDCGECGSYPCDMLLSRKGLSEDDAKKLMGDRFDREKYNDYLRAYDNISNLKDSFTPCSADCNECEKYPKECAGCSKIRGNVWWSEYVPSGRCPLYVCCVEERKLPHCGKCNDYPCDKCRMDDPTRTPEENKAIHERADERLRNRR